ncbi:hypothetical protein ACIBQ2_26385 [Micromonospora sediminimaris]|uniref:hypothetical protein n=1 Tax=Micromonospora sediminimaris TaxID=547162 RepID=UPI0037A4BFCA
MLTLTSNGFAWGAAALVAGYLARRAPMAATALLLVATTVYYGLILLVSRRWSGGTLEDGSSADAHGLLSVARAAGFWLLLSVGAGLVLGSLGYFVGNGTRHRSSAAAGLAFGMLAAEGLYQLSRDYYWPIPDDFVILSMQLATVSILICRNRRADLAAPSCRGPGNWKAAVIFAGHTGAHEAR